MNKIKSRLGQESKETQQLEKKYSQENTFYSSTLDNSERTPLVSESVEDIKEKLKDIRAEAKSNNNWHILYASYGLILKLKPIQNEKYDWDDPKNSNFYLHDENIYIAYNDVEEIKCTYELFYLSNKNYHRSGFWGRRGSRVYDETVLNYVIFHQMMKLTIKSKKSDDLWIYLCKLNLNRDPFMKNRLGGFIGKKPGTGINFPTDKFIDDNGEERKNFVTVFMMIWCRYNKKN